MDNELKRFVTAANELLKIQQQLAHSNQNGKTIRSINEYVEAREALLKSLNISSNKQKEAIKSPFGSTIRFTTS